VIGARAAVDRIRTCVPEEHIRAHATDNFLNVAADEVVFAQGAVISGTAEVNSDALAAAEVRDEIARPSSAALNVCAPSAHEKVGTCASEERVVARASVQLLRRQVGVQPLPRMALESVVIATAEQTIGPATSGEQVIAAPAVRENQALARGVGSGTKDRKHVVAVAERDFDSRDRLARHFAQRYRHAVRPRRDDRA
jgi:hypothetical protein